MPNRLLDFIRRAALLRDGGGLSDGQLLALFVKHRDGDAFEALVNRHGPMVMGVCRRVLLNQHDAEDAFQATFFIFSRKAGSINAQDSVAGWLCRVAYRTALEARARIVRRREVNDVPHPTIEPEEGKQELLALLDKEIDRLPDRYRIPVILCELEGRSRKEVARTLGIPEGTLSWRLAQAKKLLAKKLSRHGLAISLDALVGGVSPTLRASTLKSVLSAGSVSAHVLALTEGVMKAMFLTKLKITFCVALLTLVAGIGATGVAYRATAEEPTQTRVEEALTQTGRPQADDLESLRLEIEALRSELRATSRRVKDLEDSRTNEQKKLRTLESSGQYWKRMQGIPGRNLEKKISEPSPDPRFRGAAPKQMEKAPPAPKERPDPLGDAQEALRKLRTNPDDKQAAEAVERAAKWLRERDKKEERPR